MKPKKLAVGGARYDTFGGPDCTNETKKQAARGARYDTFGSPDCILTFSYHVINWLIILRQFKSDYFLRAAKDLRLFSVMSVIRLCRQD